jgi:hypothetical protein
VTLLERRRKLLTEIRTGNYNLKGAQMITFELQGWDNAKGGMRFAFPPYITFLPLRSVKGEPLTSAPVKPGGVPR